MAEADPIMRQSVNKLEAVPSPEPAAPARTRRGLRLILMLSVPVLLALAGLAYWLLTRGTIGTDNAYVRQDVVAISSDITGTGRCADRHGAGRCRRAFRQISGNRGGYRQGALGYRVCTQGI